jgi:hypothetical protein
MTWPPLGAVEIRDPAEGTEIRVYRGSRSRSLGGSGRPLSILSVDVQRTSDPLRCPLRDRNQTIFRPCGSWPLQATYLVNFAATIKGCAPARSNFRAFAPASGVKTISLNARSSAERTMELWATDPPGQMTMSGEASW